jgi:1-acyl-sn-glycerol-3-phosphate acyltransferase
MVPFKPGLGMLVAETDVPVIPCYLDGCFEALGPGQRWPSRRRINLHIGEPLVFASVSNNREGWVHIANETYTQVQKLAGRTVNQEVP